VQGPVWGLPQDAYAAMTGLSETMSPGSLASVAQSDAIAFRAEFDGEPPPPRLRYWRGPLMWDFDGRTWSAQSFVYTAPRIAAQGDLVKYEVTLEPHNRRWMFALDLPAVAPPQSIVSTDYQLYSIRPVNNRLRYDMASFLNARFGAVESRFALNRALRIPSRSNPRAQELGRALRQKHADDEGIIGEMLGMFRRNFVYTLEPPPLGEHPVDEFLFSTRSGFCEHYASAFAVVMRAAGIPTRIVTGYQGGEVNALGHYLIVRQADAHAWTEVWLDGRGWVRVDPTFAVAPVRVDTGISAAVPRTDPLPLMVRTPLAILRQVRLTWDYMANVWNQWVLGYTPERQRSLLANAGLDNATWEKLTAMLFILAGIVVAMFTVLALRQLKTRVRDPVKVAYLKFCDKLRRQGLPRDPAEGPVDYARRVERQRPELAPAVEPITRLYVALRYGAESSAAALVELQRRVRHFAA
jgi:transglutaminase-like putative cysteine protease